MAIARKKLSSCPIERTIHCIGARYKAMIVYRLLDRPRRYAELRDEITGISERILTRQLKELAADGVVERGATEFRRGGTVYSLTPQGQGLRQVFDAMFAWGELHRQPERAGSGVAVRPRVKHADERSAARVH